MPTMTTMSLPHLISSLTHFFFHSFSNEQAWLSQLTGPPSFLWWVLSSLFPLDGSEKERSGCTKPKGYAVLWNQFKWNEFQHTLGASSNYRSKSTTSIAPPDPWILVQGVCNWIQLLPPSPLTELPAELPIDRNTRWNPHKTTLILLEVLMKFSSSQSIDCQHVNW